jgi:hypothetical protein
LAEKRVGKVWLAEKRLAKKRVAKVRVAKVWVAELVSYCTCIQVIVSAGGLARAKKDGTNFLGSCREASDATYKLSVGGEHCSTCPTCLYNKSDARFWQMVDLFFCFFLLFPSSTFWRRSSSRCAVFRAN